jgi:hypothetical protein
MRQRMTIHPLMLAIALLALFALACDLGGAATGGAGTSGTQQALDSTSAALDAKLTQAAGGSSSTAAPTKEAAGDTQAAPAGGGKVTDDFSDTNDANWVLPKIGGITIADGAMTAGPYSEGQCLHIYDNDLQTQTAMNAQCFAVCKTCGIAQDYTMQVDVQWLSDSNTDKWLGLMLRFDDQNDNNIADIGKDYLLALGLAPAAGQNYSAWEFVPFDRNQPWHRTFDNAGPIQYKSYTTIKVVSSNGGMRIEIYADGKLFTTWVERKADVQVNERLLWSQLSGVKGAPPTKMSPIITKGKIGLGVIEIGGAVKYSNFSFEPH